jgi:hypothetical protein
VLGVGTFGLRVVVGDIVVLVGAGHDCGVSVCVGIKLNREGEWTGSGGRGGIYGIRAAVSWGALSREVEATRALLQPSAGITWKAGGTEAGE